MPDFDGSYKLMFRNREFVRDTLLSVLRKKKKWIELVDWNSLEPFPTEQASWFRLKRPRRMSWSPIRTFSTC